MKVLGISPLDKDSTVSLVENGRVIFALAEERLSRVKLQDGFPRRALDESLRRTGWDSAEIDAVAYAFWDADREIDLMRQGYRLDRERNRSASTQEALERLEAVTRTYRADASVPIPGLASAREFVARKPLHKRLMYRAAVSSALSDRRLHERFYREWLQGAACEHRLREQQLLEGLADYGLADRLRRFDHHQTHAANAFYSSGYDRALLVTFDGYGSGNCGAVFTGGPEGIQCLHRFPFPNSLGQHYESVTSALDFQPGRHEGKIVGPAAYGRPEVLQGVLARRFVVEDGDLSILASMNPFFSRELAQRFAMRDVAAAYQGVLEEVVQRTVAFWVSRTGLENVAVSGGVHANVKLNQRIHEIDGVSSVFVYPNMGDGGCATGAALLVDPPPPGSQLDDVYLGPEYPRAAVEAALREAGLDYREYPSRDGSAQEVAALLAENRIVARFDGKMEYGPRALGNRSILYPAHDPKVNLWLNQQLGRTEFMPFAPAALASEADRLFRGLDGCRKAAEFMTVTFDCTEFMCERCPAAVHVDGTARPQLVSASTNPGFHAVLRAYFDRTGVPAVINTSFNMHEEPIVCRPEDAIRAFLAGNVDYLTIGPFVVPHPRLEGIQKERAELELCAT